MKIKLTLTQLRKIKFWQLIIYGIIVLAILEIVYFILGFLIAIPTDLGRYFTFGMSYFTLGIFLCIVVSFFPLKILDSLSSINKWLIENKEKLSTTKNIVHLADSAKNEVDSKKEI